MPVIVLGVSGSIAAYKAADLASRLVKAGVDVYPVMTRSATQFLTPLTLSAITGRPCPVDIFDDPFPGEIAHIHLAKIADAIVIAPASMDIMAKIAHGLGGDMLAATVSAATAPVLFAPGMNTQMWNHPATQSNLAALESFGYYFVDPVSGHLACRTEGVGKMAEPEQIHSVIEQLLAKRRDLVGKRVLVTAGPTREPIDPVRFVSNRSSGKMGYAIAQAAVGRGADVVLVTGPVALTVPAGVRAIQIETAEQMERAALSEFDAADIVIAAAAVADYRPVETADVKIKSTAPSLTVSMTSTTDILAEMGRRKKGQVLVGFAAETHDLVPNATQKLTAKNLDLIVANDITAAGAGFDVDTNIVTLITRSSQPKQLPMMTKREVAEAILDAIVPLISGSRLTAT